MASRLQFRHVGVGVAGVAAVLLAAAGPAAAGPVKGTIDGGGGTDGLVVDVGDGFLAEMPTSLIAFRLADGTTLDVYCVEIETEIDPNHALVEKDWDRYPNASSPFNRNRAKINWILHNAFPVKDTDALEDALDQDLDDGLSTEEAIAATQAAIWHFSDETDLNRDDPLPTDDSAGSESDVLALYDFLIGDANEGIEAEPTASLQIDPAKLSGKPGEKIGPFTVRTSGAVNRLDAALPDGVKLVDENGTEVKAADVKDNTTLFVDVPAGAPEGEATIELGATAEVNSGRLFVGEDYSATHKTQSVIVAQTKGADLVASASAAWSDTEVEQVANENNDDSEVDNAAADEDSLAETGASILMPVLLGLGLVAAGFALLLFLRNRSSQI